MGLLELLRKLLIKAEQPTLFAVPEKPKRGRRQGKRGKPSPPAPTSKDAYQPTLFEAAERQEPAPAKPKPVQPSLLDLLKEAAKEPEEPKPASLVKKKPAGGRKGANRAHLVPVKKVVERDGKVYTQTYWVAPEEAPPVRAHHAEEEAPGAEEPPREEAKASQEEKPAREETEAPQEEEREDEGVTFDPSTSDSYGKRFVALLRKLGITRIQDGLWRRWRPEGYLPTSLEVHKVGDHHLAYLTHYREGEDGDLFIDTELVFRVDPQGKVGLEEVAYADPFGQERRIPYRQLRESGQGEKALRGAGELARVMLKNLAEMPLQGNELPAPSPKEAPPEAQPAQEAPKPKAQAQPEREEAPPEPKPELSPAPSTKPPVRAFGFDLVKGKAARKKANAQALALAKRLLKEGRPPTPEEAQVLAAYTGEGGLTGDLNAHYTPTPLAKSMWNLLVRALGRAPESALEPSMGAGVFFHTAPEGVKLEGVELSPATATVAKALWEPYGHTVHNMAFEEYNNGPGAGKSFQAVIANPPYGVRGMYGSKAKPWLKAAEEYFIDASLDRLEDGGVGVFLINPGPVENPTDEAFRLRLMARAHVLGVYQLPGSVFADSGSGVPPVVLVVKKRPDAEGMTLLRLVQRHGPEALRVAGVLDEEFLAGTKHLRPENVIGELTGQTTFKGYREVRGELTPELLERLERAPMEPYREADHEALKAKYGDEYESAKAWAESSNSDHERGRIADGTISEDGRYIFRNHRWHLLQDEDPVLSDAHALARTLQLYANALANGAREDAELYRKEALEQVQSFLATYGEAGLARVKEAVKANHALAHVLAAVEDGQPARHLREPQLPEDDLKGLASTDPEEIAKALYARKRLETNLFAKMANLTPEKAAQALWEMGYAVDESGRWEKRPLFFVGDPIGRAKALEAAADSPATPPYLKEYLRKEAEEFRNLARPKRLGEFALSPRDAYVPVEVVRAFARERRWSYGEYLYRDPETGIWSLRYPSGEEVDPRWVKKDLLEFVQYLNYNTKVERVTGENLTPEQKKALKQRYIEEARALERKIAEDFVRWLAQNPEHAEAVEKAYNEANPPYIPEPDRDDPVEERLARWRGPKLHPYQRAAIAHALERGGSIIALDVGLGKTYTGLALAENLVQEGRAKRVMVVAPRSLLGNWRNAFSELDGARWYATGGEGDLGDDEVAQDAGKVLEALRGGRMATWAELEAATGLDRQRLTAALNRLRARDLARGVPPPDVMVIGESFDERKKARVPDDGATVAQKLARLAADPSIRHVVVSRDWFSRIPVRDETVEEVISRDAYFRRLEAEKEARQKKAKKGKKGKEDDEALTARQVTQMVQAYYQKQAAKLAGPKVTATHWEDLGVEALISDEHHAFKNLHAAPSGGVFGEEKPKFMGAGSESDRAMDMLVKTAHLRGKMGGGGVFAMTATPTKNSPLEVYNMLRYITDDIHRITPTPKAFVDRYIQLGNALVPSVTGGLKVAPAVVGWKNLNELRSLLRRWVFRRTAEEVGLPIPEREDHQRIFPLHPKQEEEMQRLARETLKAISSRTEGGKIFSNMAKMRLLALDPALYSPRFAALPNPRYKAAAEIAKKALGEGGKVVMFMDLGTPSASAEGSVVVDSLDEMSDEEVAELAQELGVQGKGKNLREAVKEALEAREAATYERLRDELVAAGIPKDQIAIVTGKTAASPAARADIEAAYRAGKIRVVIGSTGIIGEGFNLQEDTTDVVHLDLPWDPGTYWQRLGRAVRQGNRQKKVRNHILMAQGSFDALTFATLKGKQGWTDILWNGHNDTAHNPEAMDTDLESYAQMVAAVSGDEEAARRFIEEQKRKKEEAEAVAKRVAALKAVKNLSMAAARLKSARALRDKPGGEERYQAALKAFEEAHRAALAHPGLPDAVREALRERPGDVMAGDRHFFVRDGAIVHYDKDGVGVLGVYKIVGLRPAKGEIVVQGFDGESVTRKVEDLENPNYRVEPAPWFTDEHLEMGAIAAMRRRGPRGLTAVAPDRMREVFGRNPQAFSRAYLEYLDREGGYDAMAVTKDGRVVYAREPGQVRAIKEMLARGEAYPVLPIPEHLQALQRALANKEIRYYDLPYFHHPFEEESGQLRFVTPEGDLIKAQGSEDLVALWRRLVKEAGHVEA